MVNAQAARDQPALLPTRSQRWDGKSKSLKLPSDMRLILSSHTRAIVPAQETDNLAFNCA
jgi:hypothetical protein